MAEGIATVSIGYAQAGNLGLKNLLRGPEAAPAGPDVRMASGVDQPRLVYFFHGRFTGLLEDALLIEGDLDLMDPERAPLISCHKLLLLAPSLLTDGRKAVVIW